MKNYFKYIFIESLQWAWIAIPLLITIGATIHSKDLAALVFLVPTIAMIVRSVIMFKEKRNGTTS